MFFGYFGEPAKREIRLAKDPMAGKKMLSSVGGMMVVGAGAGSAIGAAFDRVSLGFVLGIVIGILAGAFIDTIRRRRNLPD